MPVVPTLNTDSYPDYDELKKYLFGVAQAVPHLVNVYSIGESEQGKSLWLAEVTNQATGEPSSKPAIWFDGNAVGGELLGSVVCMALLQRLASEYGREEQVTELIDTKTFYILARMSPDGAELCLKNGLVSSTGRLGSRIGGNISGLREGLVPGDVDGDGRCYQMRIEDPRGEWKKSKRDSRLMLRREIDDRTGPFYRLYREGFLDVDEQRPLQLQSLCNLREIADDFLPQTEGLAASNGNNGSASSSLTLKETRAVCDFIRSKPNIAMAVTWRSGEGRIILTNDQQRPAPDQTLLRILAQSAAAKLSIPVVETDSKQDFADWLYLEGIPTLRANGWNFLKYVGIETKSSDFESELLTLLRWIDREGGGKGFKAWRPYIHPQLGQLEIGGWDLTETWINPPTGEPLRDICQSFVATGLLMASALPNLALSKLKDEIIGWAEPSEERREQEEDLLPVRKISCELLNEGYLSQWGTYASRSSCAPLQIDLGLDKNASLLVGSLHSQTFPLAGTVAPHLDTAANPVWFAGCSEEYRSIFEWVVRGKGPIAIRATHPRGGCLEVNALSADKIGLVTGKYVGDRKNVAVAPDTSSGLIKTTLDLQTLPGILPLRTPQNGSVVAACSSSALPPSEPVPTRATISKESIISHSEPSAPLRSAAYPEPSIPSTRSTPNPLLTSRREPTAVHPVNLTGGTRSLESRRETESPSASKGITPSPSQAGGLSGYRPSINRSSRPMGTSSSEPVAIKEFQKPPVVESPTPMNPIREESPLRKESSSASVSSGRVFGQAPNRSGPSALSPSALGGFDRSSGPSLKAIEDIPLPDARSVRPHSLVSGTISRNAGAPQDSAPESHPSMEDGLEGPPSVSRIAAPRLLRRSRDNEDR